MNKVPLHREGAEAYNLESIKMCGRGVINVSLLREKAEAYILGRIKMYGRGSFKVDET